MMLESFLRDKIEYVLENMSTDEQFDVYREYCEYNSYYDDMPYICDYATLDDFCQGMTPSDIIEKYGDINFSWDYFVEGIWGVEEWTEIEDIDSVVDYIINNENDLGNAEIADILDMFIQTDVEEFAEDFISEHEDDIDTLTAEELVAEILEALAYETEIEVEDIKIYEELEYQTIIDVVESYLEED